MLSLCMIVKNEEQNLEKCLSKIKPIIDEIIIVDTGSVDNTKEIAVKFTDKVYDFVWCDDFSSARNFSISKATYDWVLILDADEFIERFDKQNILDFINSKENIKTVGRIKEINIIEDSFGDRKSFERISRLFNKKYFHYEGIIHEQVTHIEKESFKTNSVDITVKHIGYTEKELNRTKKLERNIGLLNNAVKNNSKDSYLYYQLGKSYYMSKQYEKCCEYFKNALSFSLDYRLEYVEDLIVTHGYALINAGRFNEALMIEDYREYYKNNVDYDFLMGLIYMNNAKFNLAVQNFLKCTEEETGKIEGINTYLPNYNIGVIFECLGYTNEAVSYYKKCGDYQLAVMRIKALS